MKRLIRKASNTKLYHATSAQRLVEILNAGEIGTDQYADNGGDSNGVFLGSNPNNVLHYGTNVIRSGNDKSMPDWAVVIEVDVDTNNLRPDMDDWMIGGGDRNENPNPTWEDSLKELDQVMHEGRIPASQITKIYSYIEDEMTVELNNCEILLMVQFNEAVKYLSQQISKQCTPDEFIMEWNVLGSNIENEEVDW